MTTQELDHVKFGAIQTLCSVRHATRQTIKDSISYTCHGLGMQDPSAEEKEVMASEIAHFFTEQIKNI